jgi:GT2 family glycosyltransferase
MVRSALLREVGGFDEKLLHLADWDMWIRLVSSGKPTACEDVHVAYRIHRRSMTASNVESVHDIQHLITKHAPVHLDEAAMQTFADRWRAHAHRVHGRRVQAAREYLISGIRNRRPEMLLRSMGVLGGERTMRLRDRMGRVRGEPQWLAVYRDAVRREMLR